MNIIMKLKSTYENAADYQALEGDTKAEQSIPTEAKSVTHRTIAVTTIVSNQVIADNNSLQLHNYLSLGWWCAAKS